MTLNDPISKREKRPRIKHTKLMLKNRRAEARSEAKEEET